MKPVPFFPEAERIKTLWTIYRKYSIQVVDLMLK
jgi:hypothetical protein